MWWAGVTLLGVAFAVLYGFGLSKGRRGLLFGIACAVPFNDSAAVVVGSVAVSPFYLGLILLVPAVLGAEVIGKGREGLKEHAREWEVVLKSMAVRARGDDVCASLFQGWGLLHLALEWTGRLVGLRR